MSASTITRPFPYLLLPMLWASRNRARRRLKEAVRLTAPSHAIEGYDYVLIAREGTVQRRFTALINDLERAFAMVHAPSRQKRR